MDIASSSLPAIALRRPQGRRVPGGAFSVLNPQEPAAARTGADQSAAPARSGRTLADYRAHAVQRVAPIVPDGGRAAPPSAAPAPSAMTVPPAMASAMTRAREPEAAGAKAPDSHPVEGFAAAMLKGLDRYRAMHRPSVPQPRVDLAQ